MCLVDQFLTYVGHDWHWFCLRTFRERLEATYKVSGAPESRDRVWLCKLLVVFAIGKAFNGEIGDIEISTEGYSPPEQQDVGVTVAAPTESQPGKQFFEQALQLLKVPYEEVQVEHIEVLNLVVRYPQVVKRTCH